MELLDIVVQLGNAFLHVYIGYVFFASFWKIDKLEKITVLYLLLPTIVFWGALVFFKGSLILYVPMFLITLAITFLFKSRMVNKLLITILYLVINGVIEMLVGFVISILFNVDINTASNSFGFLLSGMLISKIVVFLIVLFISVKKSGSLLQQYKVKYLSVFIFPASTLAIAILQGKFFLEYPHQDLATKYGVLVSYVGLILANIIVFDFIDSLYKNTINESQLRIADEIIHNQTVQYQTLIDHNQKVMQLRHDHKNFCVGLRTELEKGNIHKAIKILDGEYDVSKSESIIDGNVALTIINIKQKVAESQNIDFICECGNVDLVNIHPTDLAIILGNALDNAIDACEMISDEEERYIETSISLKNNSIYITIKNPVESDKDINSLVSTKKDGVINHGFGIISMRRLAKKYNGEVLFSCENKLFTTVIILKTQ